MNLVTLNSGRCTLGRGAPSGSSGMPVELQEAAGRRPAGKEPESAGKEPAFPTCEDGAAARRLPSSLSGLDSLQRAAII